MAKVKLFAALRDAAGTDGGEFDAPDVDSLLGMLKERFGEGFSRSLSFSKVAVNGTLIDALQGLNTPLSAGDEVALLPPVSGG